MNTLTGAALGGLLGVTNIKVGDLTKNQKIAILALAGALIVNMHKKLHEDPMHKPTPSMEAYRFKDERRA